MPAGLRLLFRHDILRARMRGLELSERVRAARDEYHVSIAPIRAHHQELVQLECRLSDRVNAAYGLTPEQVDLLWRTAPGGCQSLHRTAPRQGRTAQAHAVPHRIQKIYDLLGLNSRIS
jgi:hypothetical protein